LMTGEPLTGNVMADPLYVTPTANPL